MKKDKAIEILNKLPSEFDLDELIEKLIFIDKVEKGNQQIKAGKTKTHQEVKDLTKQWLK